MLWDTFTGSAPYRSVLKRGLNPAFAARFTRSLLEGLRHGDSVRPKDRVTLATGTTGLSGKRYGTGDVVIAQGAEAGAVFVVEDGRIELVRVEGDLAIPLATLGPGEFFGGAGVFDDGCQGVTARATEPSVVVALARPDILKRVHEEPAMAFKLIEAMAHRIAGLERIMIDHARRLGPSWEPYAELAAPRSSLDAAETPGLAAGVGGMMGREFTTGDLIYSQGDRGNCMFVVHGGAVEVLRREGEDEFLLAVLGEGDFFGEGALFDEEVRPDTVRALDRTFVFTLERNGLLVRIHEDPSAAFQLIENMFRRVNLLERGIARTAQPSDAIRA
jgi:CRP-like cAMP-binding protein